MYIYVIITLNINRKKDISQEYTVANVVSELTNTYEKI